MGSQFKIIFALIAGFGFVACNHKSESIEEREIRSNVESHIAIGATKERVIAFFQEQKWMVEYDKWHKCYTAWLTVEKRGDMIVHSVIVSVYISNDKVSRIDISEAFKP